VTGVAYLAHCSEIYAVLLEIVVNFLWVLSETFQLPLGINKVDKGVHIRVRESENADCSVGRSLFEPLFEEPKKWEVSKYVLARGGMRGEVVCPGIVTSAGPYH